MLVAKGQSEQGALEDLPVEHVGESEEVEQLVPRCSHVRPSFPVQSVLVLREVPHPGVPVQVLKSWVHNQ